MEGLPTARGPAPVLAWVARRAAEIAEPLSVGSPAKWAITIYAAGGLICVGGDYPFTILIDSAAPPVSAVLGCAPYKHRAQPPVCSATPTPYFRRDLSPGIRRRTKAESASVAMMARGQTAACLSSGLAAQALRSSEMAISTGAWNM